MLTYDVVTDDKNKITVAWASLDTVINNNQVIHVDATGSSRCMMEDPYDEVVGEKLALGRALSALGKKLEREAFAVVHEKDRQREAALEGSRVALEERQAKTQKFLEEFALLIQDKLNKEQNIGWADLRKDINSQVSSTRRNLIP